MSWRNNPINQRNRPHESKCSLTGLAGAVGAVRPTTGPRGGGLGTGASFPVPHPGSRHHRSNPEARLASPASHPAPRSTAALSPRRHTSGGPGGCGSTSEQGTSRHVCPCRPRRTHGSLRRPRGPCVLGVQALLVKMPPAPTPAQTDPLWRRKGGEQAP